MSLAGEVLASHYAEPVPRIAASGATLRDAASEEASVLRQLKPGEAFALLEESLGWCWGYAVSDHRVGYVQSDALRPAS